MVGFIKNIFGGNSDDNNQNGGQKKQKAFYLDPDEAKTFGDIDYMRKPNTVRRSFPKSVSNPEGGEQVEEVSALEKKSLSKKKNQPTQPQPSAQSSEQNVQEGQMYSAKDDPQIQERRQSDSSLDMFRNMARDIKK
ncbi:hypothetical protein PCC7418_3808 [Halothece sp. PCC 7418]|uniref:hypothetical protein n=1 Tax=Halothece sp. (strain PCC 7418) TaxID=65093 RepID=UPI0002A075F0|nr:hypothetical protein [Halothece sp. PCC 7418]AFZ45912.1 hypothetical protein PCC7418_3808 [Halothece sp. PCC 7418]